jgi:hypothetical protein
VDAKPTHDESIDEFTGKTEDVQRIRTWSPVPLTDALAGVVWRTHRAMVSFVYDFPLKALRVS